MISQLRNLTVATLIALASIIPACSDGPGKCVGAAGGASQDKVLVSLNGAGAAIYGYDPVAYFTESKAVKGDPQVRSSYGGAVYYFANSSHKTMFEADPAKYAPQFGGYCAYAASIDTISPIDPEYWEIVDGRLILQHNKRAWDLWHKDSTGNLVKADRNWPGLVERNGSAPRALLFVDDHGIALGGFDPTSYFIDGAPRKGDAAIERSFQGATYRFVDTEHKNAFEREPAKYSPQFGGFCGYAASLNRVSPANPEIWQLVDGHLVLQHTPEAQTLFNRDILTNYAKAQQNWPGLSHQRCD